MFAVPSMKILVSLINISKFNIPVNYEQIMNTVRASVRKNQTLSLDGFLNSLYFAFPVGMFLTACNFLFESVRNYFFNWWIVALPTLAILVVWNVYEALLMYQKSEKKKDVFISKPSGYAITKSKMVGELV
jgi:hypothetical protein